MKDSKILFRGSVFLLTTVVWASGCNLAQKSTARSSSDAIGDVLGQAGDSAVVASKESYKPLTGRMDGVEFYINKELMTAGLETGKSDFKELHSVFDQPSKMWQPQQKGYSIPVVRNAQVEQWIRYFTGPIRSNFERWIRRGSQYVPIMEKILKEEGVPADLIYLSMIESGFNTQAYSHAHAAGLWQFIPGTGRMYGLESGGDVDERRDIIKATQAAARHLKDLYKMYGNWYLAFAAYNAGPGTVNRALKNSPTRDFWKLSASRKRVFRQETRDYVPRILAAAIIMKNYKKYGFSSDLFQKPMAFESLQIPDATDISTLAQCAGLSDEEMKYYNPSLISGITPVGKPYVIHVPVGTSSSFKKNFAKIVPTRRTIFVAHKVKRKETLKTIARRYKTTEKIILSSNKLSSYKQVRVGMSLKIPRQISGGSKGVVTEVSTVAMASPTTLSAGAANIGDESAARSPQSVEDVLEEDFEGGDNAPNNVAMVAAEDDAVGIPELTPTETEEPSVLSTEKFRVTPAKTYRVKRGDTLYSIAKANKTTVDSIRKWNNLAAKSLLKSGQSIKVSAEQKTRITEVAAAPALNAGNSVAGETNSNTLQNYKVLPGDTLAQIAAKKGVTVALIREWNQLEKGAVIKSGQNLKIGAALWTPPATSVSDPSVLASVNSQTTPATGNVRGAVYKVRSGDTLSSIARTNNVTVKELMDVNGINNASNLKVGQVIKLDGTKIATKSGSVVNKQSGKMIIHAVRKGETLWTLSQRYGVTVAKIKQWNGLKQNSLSPNQKLKIYSAKLSEKLAELAA